MSQGEANVWYFGDSAGIDFNSGTAVGISNGAISTLEGCASISDTNGNLLFYTNGVTVWDRNHDIMLNGTGLLGHVSATQSAIIVPKPNNTLIYYIFTSPEASAIGLRYSEVNMALNGGLGAVTANKNVFLMQPATEKLTAVAHHNQQDVWLIAHEHGSNSFYAYLVSNTGVNINPVISSVGSNNNGLGIGYLKAAPNGELIASARYNGISNVLEMFDFDNQSGILSNPIDISVSSNSYGLEFSPDGSKLYTSNGGDTIFQYDLSGGTPSSIIASYLDIGTTTPLNAWAMQLGPDEKIYVSKMNGSWLGVINFPNVAGVACDYQDDGVSLGSAVSQRGLPSFVQSFFGHHVEFTKGDTCFGDTTSFQLSNLTNITGALWNFDDSASGASNISTALEPNHVFTSSGTYKVQVEVYYHDTMFNILDTIQDSLQVSIHEAPFVSLGNDSILCDGDSMNFAFASSLVTTYLWNNSSTNPFNSLTTTGIHWLVANNVCGNSSDTVQYLFQTPLDPDLGPDTTICENASYLLAPNLTGQTNLIQINWSDSSNNPTFLVTQPGSYHIEVQNACGYASDSVVIGYATIPVPNLGNDTVFCTGHSLVLNAYWDDLSTYSWNTGQTGAQITVSTDQLYTVEVTNLCGTGLDEIQVGVDVALSPNIGSDTFTCAGIPYTWDATSPNNPQYLWNTGDSTATIAVTEGGKYRVTITNTCGSYVGQGQLEIIEFPSVDLGADTFICFGDVLELEPADKTPVMQWQNGSTRPKFTVDEPGYYSLFQGNVCGSDIDSIYVDLKSLPEFNLGNDTVICQQNADIVLDPSIPGMQYLWQDGSTHQQLTVREPGFYSLLLVDPYGCEFEDEIEITACQSTLFIPKAFTPNNDFVNDKFAAYGAFLVKYSMRVYDRWGRVVFHTSSLDKGWDGTNNGRPLPDGIYAYVISYQGDDAQTKTVKGEVKLLR